MVSKAARAGTPGTERTRRQQLGLLRLVIVLGLVDGVTILLCPRAITSANAVPWGGLFAEMRNSCAEMKSLAACQISSLGVQSKGRGRKCSSLREYTTGAGRHGDRAV